MSNVHPFTPRPRARPSSGAPALNVRSQIEEAAQAALDTVEHLITILNAMDGDPDREDGADAKLSLAAPEHHASQVIWLRGSDSDLETQHQDKAR